MNKETPAFAESLGLDVPSGQEHYRAYVGPPEDYDLVAAMSFGLLTLLGLRQQHRVLDLGCGSLRIGRLLIPYLNHAGYTGLEPNRWLVEAGIQREIGQDQVRIKRPRFVISDTGDPLVAEGRTYDYILAQSIFSHCGPDLLDQWLFRISRLLEDSGTLVATYVESESDTERLGWTYPECVAFTRATVADMAHRHGFEFIPLDWHHPRQSWALFAKPGFAKSYRNLPLTWNARFENINARGQSIRQA